MGKQFFQFARHLLRAGTRADDFESRVATVALLVDGENIAADFAVHLLVHAGKFGGVSFCRVYGNWAAPTMQRWQEMTTHYGMNPRHQQMPVAGKNGTDIALTVDAMEMFHDGVRRFCLASGDSDYTPLVRRLVEKGCVVVVIGRPDTSLILQRASTVFISTEQLQPGTTRGKNPPAGSSFSGATEGQVPTNSVSTLAKRLLADSENSDIQKLLLTAYSKIVADTNDALVALTRLGTILKQIDPYFTAKAYGCSTLKALIRKHAPAFQVQETSSGQAHIMLQEQLDEPDSQHT